MPAQSAAQFRAMQAAAHGKSSLGIPPAVGEEYAEQTPQPGSLPARAKRRTSPLADAMRKKQAL